MARYAREERGFAGPVVLEEESRSTWQNVANTIPLIESADQIKIVSEPLHAYRARRYLRQQRPDLAARLTRGADYRLGEWIVLKPFFTVYGLLALAKAEQEPGGPR